MKRSRVTRFEREQIRDFAVLLRFEVAKGEVFELPLDLPNAQPVREGSEDLLRFKRDPPLLFDRKGPSVRMLCSRSQSLISTTLNVLGHGKEHFAKVLRLGSAHAEGVDAADAHRELVELRQPVDELGRLVAPNSSTMVSFEMPQSSWTSWRSAATSAGGPARVRRRDR